MARWLLKSCSAANHTRLNFRNNLQIFQNPLSFPDDDPFYFEMLLKENLLTRKFSEVT